MLLAFDVGNTNIVLGLYEGEKLLENWRMDTDKNKSADEYGMLIHQLFAFEGRSISDVDDVIISTVVPSLTYTLQHMSRKYFNTKAIVVGPGVKTGLIVKYDNPKQLGADRIVNSVAALSKYGGPVIVVDFGTATTICGVTKDSEFLGGVIAPGIKIGTDALFEKTARLPRVELETPGHVLCRSTIEGIQAGVIYGNMGLTERLVAMMKAEMKAYTHSEEEPVVVATGGMASLMAEGMDCIDHVDKLLTLTGLQLIYEKNRQLGRRGRGDDRSEEFAES